MCTGPLDTTHRADHGHAVPVPSNEMVEAKGKVIHASHKTGVAHGQRWCWKCALVALHSDGGHGRLNLLTKECRDNITPSGETVLRRLRRGLPPKAGQNWPDGTAPPNGGNILR
eukprot:4140898-Pyramimonas_sp.AAC.1